MLPHFCLLAIGVQRGAQPESSRIAGNLTVWRKCARCDCLGKLLLLEKLRDLLKLYGAVRFRRTSPLSTTIRLFLADR